MKIYTLLTINNSNGAGINTDIKTFEKLQDAKKEFKTIKNNFLKDIKNEIDDWQICDILGNCFNAYEDGFENEHFFVAEIKETTLNKDERLDILLNNVCAYLYELCKNYEEFFTKEHSKMCFGMTEKEHKKYILGE